MSNPKLYVLLRSTSVEETKGIVRITPSSRHLDVATIHDGITMALVVRDADRGQPDEEDAHPVQNVENEQDQPGRSLSIRALSGRSDHESVQECEHSVDRC